MPMRTIAMESASHEPRRAFLPPMAQFEIDERLLNADLLIVKSFRI
jgi:hypothetical protein